MDRCCSPQRAVRPGESADIATPIDTASRTDVAADSRNDMIWVDAGSFTMGTDDPHRVIADGEAPRHHVEIGRFAIGRFSVTNRAFGEFVDATGHVTTAEHAGDSFVFGGHLPEGFPPTRAIAAAPWWRLVEGADWRHPEGPHSDVGTRDHHPVVHVSWFDAVAYCEWAGVALPTEAQWERAARGGVDDAPFPWGHVLEPDGSHRMNVFQGSFPADDSGADGWVGTCPVGSYPPNGFGLHEVTGNVWEWCADWFDPTYYERSPRQDPAGPGSGSARVMRGGSYLCHDSYCRRYRVDARSSSSPDATAGNIGFRIARREPS